MRGFTDIMIEVYYSDCDPAYTKEIDDDIEREEREEETKEIMADLFKQMKKVFDSFTEEEKEIILENEDKAYDIFTEIMEG